MSKPSRKSPPPPAPPPTARGRTPLALGGVALAALAIGAIVFMQLDSARPESPAQAAAAPVLPPDLSAGGLAKAEALANPGSPAEALANTGSSAEASAKAGTAAAVPAPISQPAVVLGPHPQKEFPPLRLPAYPLARSPEMITAAYRFAAEHPEILSYIPCFCGCERSGHRGNEDCFVQKRAANGDVTEWTEHGMECAVCLDVAQQAMQMHASGASVRDIRAAVETKWATQAAQSHTHTPTPEPPR
jgi:hypothetical protein